MATTTVSRHVTYGPVPALALLTRLWRVNPPLVIAGSMSLLTFAAALVGLVVDPQVITGLPAWVKPAKFAISVSIYLFTFVWLLSHIKGHNRLVAITGTLTALALVIEMAALVLQVVRGTTSHFNVSTPFDQTVWSVMGATIGVLWLMAFGVAILLLFQRMENPTFAWALRLGIFISIAGMGVGVLMTQPTAAQSAALAAGQAVGTIGAHTVGVADGGPGLPFLGWSTVGGDLRIPHFVGLHALQILPLFGWSLTRFARNLRPGQQTALVWTFGAGYLGLIGLLTWQAERAQSIIAPDSATLTAFGALAAGVAAITTGILRFRRARAA